MLPSIAHVYKALHLQPSHCQLGTTTLSFKAWSDVAEPDVVLIGAVLCHYASALSLTRLQGKPVPGSTVALLLCMKQDNIQHVTPSVSHCLDLDQLVGGGASCGTYSAVA